MKIVFVESYPQVVYGQQRTLLSLLETARKAGHHSLVACTAEGPFVNAVREAGEETVILPYPSHLATYGGAIYRYGWRRKAGMAWQLVGYVRQLRQWLKAQRPSVVFCNDMRGLLTMGVAARMAGIPVIIWDKLDKPHGILDWFQLPLTQLNIIISDAVRVKYPKQQQRWFQKRIHKVHEGVDLERYSAHISVREPLGLTNDHIVLAMVGSISERKGQDRLMRLIPQLAEYYPQLRVLLVGDPDESARDYFMDLPNRDHPNVMHVGFRDDIPAVMQSIDSLLILSRQEGMGMVIVEAMAAGKPVIGTRAGGIPEVVVDGETGLLVEGDDDDALLEAIATLCDDAVARRRMGEAGRARAEAHFDRPKQHARVIELMEQLVETQG